MENEITNETLSLKNVLTEKDVCELFGMTKNQVGSMRYQGLPFIALSKTSRLFFESDLVAFFKKKRIIIAQS